MGNGVHGTWWYLFGVKNKFMKWNICLYIQIGITSYEGLFNPTNAVILTRCLGVRTMMKKVLVEMSIEYIEIIWFKNKKLIQTSFLYTGHICVYYHSTCLKSLTHSFKFIVVLKWLWNSFRISNRITGTFKVRIKVWGNVVILWR